VGGLSTLLGAGTEIRFGDDTSDLVRAIRQSPQQSGSQAPRTLAAEVDNELAIELGQLALSNGPPPK
jgi:hypothetical protein